MIKKNLADKDWLAQNLPSSPGIYQIYDKDQSLIYIGKAKNLRRRLLQYKNAKRTKKHWKMRALVKEGHEIKVIVCATEVEAAMQEVQWIQKHRPKYNVEAAYFFLYPSFYVRRQDQEMEIVFSTQESGFAGWKRYGCFRSREFAKEAFYSLRFLWGYLGHVKPVNKSKLHLPKYSMGYAVRQLERPEEWETSLGKFLHGQSLEFLELLSLALIERTSARAGAARIQRELRNLRRFFYFEARPIRKVCERFALTPPIPQLERDLLWRKYRYESRHSKG